MGSHMKDSSVLTNYQQKQLQYLEQQSQAAQQSSQKSIENLSGLRSKSIDKSSAAGQQKFNQQQFLQ